MTPLKLGTRGSQLALFQANTVAALLHSRAGAACEIVVIKTSGDRLAEAPLSDVGGKRLFVKEIEDALLDGAIDLAVHSSKDMPAVLPDGLALGAVLPRADATRRAGVARAGSASRHPAYYRRSGFREADPPSARGDRAPARTCPADRHEQCPADGAADAPLSRCAIRPIRGNLDTRLRKVDAGDFDVLVLAAAGLDPARTRSTDFGGHFRPETCVPAPGQGIIAVEDARRR